MADLRCQNKAACPKRSEMVAGCFGFWLFWLRSREWLVDSPKSRGGAGWLD